MGYFPGKFARFKRNGLAVRGPFRWGFSAKRESIDTTSFESPVSADGQNVAAEHETGPLDTGFVVEGFKDSNALNIFFPGAALVGDLLFKKSPELGYKNVPADVLDLSDGTAVREVGKFTANLQTNGWAIPVAPVN